MYLLGFEYQVSPNMLCLETWCGALPARLPSYKFGTLQVFSKLGGNFLGCVAKPCLESFQDATKAYAMLRDMQAHVALLLKHAYLPSRYLALYVGSHRVTSPSFPFKDCLDQEQLGLVKALCGATRIDVMYDGDTDFGVAEASLGAKNLVVVETHRGNLCVDYKNYYSSKQIISRFNVIVHPELDVWAFSQDVKGLRFHISAERLGDLHYFPGLKRLTMFNNGHVRTVDFGSLASACKSLVELAIRLEVDSSSLLGINKLSILKHLEVTTRGSGKATIPREVGSLSKLQRLLVRGQQITGQIPTEIGQLRDLYKLVLEDTKLSSCIPSEFGNLVKLIELDLSNNKHLHGELPQELNKLSRLDTLSLSSTPNVTRRLFKRQGEWEDGTWYKTQ